MQPYANLNKRIVKNKIEHKWDKKIRKAQEQTKASIEPDKDKEERKTEEEKYTEK